MPSSGRRKQRYVLDIDDVVRAGFMTKTNEEALMRGINASEGTVQLSVPFGGTNNALFNDQELIMYDAATQKLVSSGLTGLLPGGQSVFYPWETGVLYSKQGVDLSTVSASEVAIVDQTFTLPNNNTVWSDLLMHFSFRLNVGSVNLTGLRILLGDDVTEPSTIISPDKTFLYRLDDEVDYIYVQWTAMGHVPAAHIFDSELHVRLMAVPSDAPGFRTCLTRVSYRGVVPEEGGVRDFSSGLFDIVDGIIGLSSHGFPTTPMFVQGMLVAQTADEGGYSAGDEINFDNLFYWEGGDEEEAFSSGFSVGKNATQVWVTHASNYQTENTQLTANSKTSANRFALTLSKWKVKITARL